MVMCEKHLTSRYPQFKTTTKRGLNLDLNISLERQRARQRRSKMSELLEVYEASTSASLAQYKAAHASSISDVSGYWSELAKSKLTWFAPFSEGLSGSFEEGSVSWFAGGRINVCYNAVDRYCCAPFNRGEIRILTLAEADANK